MQASFEKIDAVGRSFVVCERQDPAFPFAWHYHPEVELTFIVESSGTRFVGDSIASYGPGDFVLLGPDLPHTWKSAVSRTSTRRAARHAVHRAVYAQFRADFAGPGLLAAPECMAIRKLLGRAGRGLRFPAAARALGERRMPELLNASGARRISVLLELLDDLAQVRGAQYLTSEGYAPWVRRQEQQRIDRVCGFLHERFTQPVRQPEAARQAHLSIAAFSRFFKRALGRSFTDYLQELRIGHACRQLIESERSVAEIAVASGFPNLSHFHRCFLAAKHMTPRAYRVRFAEGARLPAAE